MSISGLICGLLDEHLDLALVLFYSVTPFSKLVPPAPEPKETKEKPGSSTLSVFRFGTQS